MGSNLPDDYPVAKSADHQSWSPTMSDSERIKQLTESVRWLAAGMGARATIHIRELLADPPPRKPTAFQAHEARFQDGVAMSFSESIIAQSFWCAALDAAAAVLKVPHAKNRLSDGERILDLKESDHA